MANKNAVPRLTGSFHGSSSRRYTILSGQMSFWFGFLLVCRLLPELKVRNLYFLTQVHDQPLRSQFPQRGALGKQSLKVLVHQKSSPSNRCFPCLDPRMGASIAWTLYDDMCILILWSKFKNKQPLYNANDKNILHQS